MTKLSCRSWPSLAFAPQLALLLGFAVACSSSDPVASTPLKGTVFGAPFEAKVANLKAIEATPGLSSVLIYSRDVPCNADDTERPSLDAQVTWKTGTVEADLSSSKTTGVGFRRYKSAGSIESIQATKGRLEVIQASDTAGTMRIRAEDEQGNTVEGEIAVRVCPAPAS